MKAQWDKFAVKFRELNERSNGWLLYGVLIVGVVMLFRQGRRAF